MLNKFVQFIKAKELCQSNSNILVALSGGPDSVALLHLLKRANHKVSAAHCNFLLRGEDSMGDEAFVKQLCKDLDIELHVKRFNTLEYAKVLGISIEMAARDLRYKWFKELSTNFYYDTIATGHHLNDSIETLLLNLTRGTGIKGITGISVKNGNVIRPLLWAKQEEINNYLEKYKLKSRHDKSNDSDAHQRNLIRNKVIPLLKQINPGLEQSMQQNINSFKDTAQVIEQEVNKCRNRVMTEENGQWIIDRELLLNCSPKHLYLFELLQEFNFTADTVNKILSHKLDASGQVFKSPSHTLLLNRKQLIVKANKTKDKTSYLINKLEELNATPLAFELSTYDSKGYVPDKNPKVANLDLDALSFPLTLRKWNTGDYFYPFGMRGKKKLSDFFIDNKLDRFQKENVWILESQGEIVWIVGYRIDQRFSIAKNTKQILKLKVLVNP